MEPPASDSATPDPQLPDSQLPDQLIQQATALHRAGQLAQAEALYRQVLRADPHHVDALYHLGSIACQSRQYALALELAERGIVANPNLAGLHAVRGNALAGLQEYQAALTSYDRAVQLKPDFVATHYDRGNMLYALQRYQDAVASYDHAIRLQPHFAGAHANRGIALNALGQYQAAIASFDQAILLQPNFAELHGIRGIALYSLRQYRAALDSLNQAILLKPDYAEAHNNRGSTLSELGENQAALESFDRALQLNPNYAEAHSNRGNALHALRQYQAAVAACDRALELNPSLAEAWNNRGNSLFALQRYREAQHCFNQAIRLKPGFADAHNNLGSALCELRQPEAALDAIDRAIQLHPNFAPAHSNRGNVLQHLGRYPLALQSFTRALQLDPGCDYAGGTSLHAKRFLCDWDNFEAETRQVEASIDRNRKAAIPFTTLALTASPALQRRAAETYIRDRYPAPAHSDAVPIPRRPQRGKIRIGYFSADFRRHAVSYLIADLFERHDRSKFEIYGFSFIHDGRDQMTDRVAAAMDRFVDVLDLSDGEVVELSRNLEVDIAVDLMGFTKHHRPGIFAQRAAPIQVNYLGYPGTMGAGYIDYLIADSTLIPESAQHHYSEKIVYLPDTYQANDSHRPISAKPCTRADQGLPENAFVYCCFNAANKIAPPVFDIWMRILAQVPGSVLWLLEDLPQASANLRSEAARRGITPGRLIFAHPLPQAEHLAREKLADLFLDTFPYAAHTTASDALWVGLPVLTRMGDTFASRVAASLLRAVDLPELITETPADYENLAIELARNPERLRRLREKLDRNRLTTPLFDTARFTQNLEAAYTAMHSRYQAGLPPGHIHITPSAAPQPPVSVATDIDLQLQQAMAHHHAGQLPQAEALYRQILRADPNHVHALYLLSVIASQSGQFAAAVALIDKAILSNPNIAEHHAARGNALAALQQYQAALESLDHAVLLKPDLAEVYGDRGNLLCALQRYPEAIASYDRAIQLRPGFAPDHCNRGKALNALGQYQAAIASFDQAILLQPSYAEAHHHRGVALYLLRQFQTALESLNQAILHRPDYAEAYSLRGSALNELHQDEAAVESFDCAIQLNPNDATAHGNRANALLSLRQYRAAIESCDRALQLNPDSVEVWSNRGNSFYKLDQYPLALESFNTAMRLDPDYAYVAGTRLHVKRLLCDWQNLEAECRQLEGSIERNQRATNPFSTLALIASPALQRKAAEIYVHDRYPAPADVAPIARHPHRGKIRIGYFSTDFNQHPVSVQMIDVFERIDRSRFEIIAFSFGPEIEDEMTHRVRAAMDQFIDVRSLSDREVVELSRKLEVDIAVDLMGFTGYFRVGIFAQRAAPVQVNYLGYPGTMGADYIDYLIADSTLVPEASRLHYSEKIVYLPDSFQANSRNPISDKHYTRADQGLPEQGFVFCCFNNSYKIGPATFAVWMRILQQVEGSILWLLGGNPLAEANLRKQAARHGTDPQHIFFAQRLPLAEHLSRQRVADLFLDTLPFNAGATASPALWSGLPVLTCIGETFAGRMGASLLRAIDLSELITTSEQAFENLAIELAHNPERLRHLREKLDRNRLTTPLFDTARFTQNLEAAYTAMLQRYHAGLPPDHIHIPGSPHPLAP